MPPVAVSETGQGRRGGWESDVRERWAGSCRPEKSTQSAWAATKVVVLASVLKIRLSQAFKAEPPMLF